MNIHLQKLLEGLPSCYTIRWLQSAVARRVFMSAAREPYALVHLDTIGLAPFRRFFPDTPATQEGRRVQSYESQIAEQFAVHVTCSELDSERLSIPNGVDVDYFQSTTITSKSDPPTLYLCPIRDGGGTKLKLLDAFAM